MRYHPSFAKTCLYAAQCKPEAISITSDFFQLTRGRFRSFLADYYLSMHSMLLSMLSEIYDIFTTHYMAPYALVS